MSTFCLRRNEKREEKNPSSFFRERNDVRRHGLQPLPHRIREGINGVDHREIEYIDQTIEIRVESRNTQRVLTVSDTGPDGKFKWVLESWETGDRSERIFDFEIDDLTFYGDRPSLGERKITTTNSGRIETRGDTVPS